MCVNSSSNMAIIVVVVTVCAVLIRKFYKKIWENIIYGILVCVVKILNMRIPSFWEKQNVPTLSSNQLSNFEFLSLGEQLGIAYLQIRQQGTVDYFGFYKFGSPIFVPTNLNLIEQILKTDHNCFEARTTIDTDLQPISQHIFSSKSDRWRILRRKIQSAFTEVKLKTMFETILMTTGSLLEHIDTLIQNHEPINVKYVVGCFTMDVIGHTAFGIECNSFVNESNDFIKNCIRTIQPSQREVFLNSVLLTWPKLARCFRLKPIPESVETFFSTIVRDIVKYREENNVERPDFIQLLMNIKNENVNNHDLEKFDIDDVIAQSFLIFITGYEASSATMNFALYELSKNQNFQDKAREEVRSVLRKYKGTYSFAAISEMKFLEQIIYETLRKYPPSPIISRRCTKRYQVPNSDLILEEGISVIIPNMGLHMDPEYFPEPDNFDPDRFSSENEHAKQPYSFLAFGSGPRHCLGFKFAVLETRLCLAKLLENITFTLNENTREPLEYNNGIFLSSKYDIFLNANYVD